MYARTITIDAQRDYLDAGIAFVRDEAFDAVTATPGCIGMSFVVDRDTCRCIVTSAWDSEASLHASQAPLADLRHRGSEVFGGPLMLEEWEIAVMHRNHPSPAGACVRATYIEGDPAQTDRAIDVFRLGTLPAIEMLEGFCSVSLMVNRDNGQAISSVTYDSRGALERTRESANRVRAEGTQEPRMAITDVREFDLVMAHLHVPELV